MAQSAERLEIKLIIPKEEKKQLPAVEDKKEREVKIAPSSSAQAQPVAPKPLPEDWLKQLAKLLHGSKELGIGKSHETATEKDYHDHLRRHLGLKKEKPILNKGLEENLQTIFLLLTDEHPKDRLNKSEKTMVYTKVLEDTFECSEGFVIRVNHALISLKAPQSMHELLGHNAQEWLEAALFKAGITEIHSSRFCFKIASELYPWVKDPNPDDIYPPQLDWVTTEWAKPFVQKTFDKHFTLFPNYQVSRKKIREILGQYGYAGPVLTENYYKEPSTFVKYLAKLFDEPSDTPEAIDQLIATYMVSKKDEALDMEVPVDIHWEAVDKKLYAVLTERYFEIATYTYEHRLAQIINKTGDQAYFKHQLKSVFSPKSCEDLASFDAFIGLENKETHKRIITFLKEFKNNAAEALDELVYAASSFNFSRDEARDLLLHVLAHNPFTTEQILTGKFLSLVYRYAPPLLSPVEQQNIIFSEFSTEEFYVLLTKAASLNLTNLRSVLFSETFSSVNPAFNIQALFEKSITSGHVQAAKWLIEQGAKVDLNFRNDEGILTTSLHEAVDLGSIELVRVLLDAGANANINTETETPTPLYLALDLDDGNIDIIKLLLERGADPDVKYGSTSSSLEFIQSVIETLKNQREELLLKRYYQAGNPGVDGVVDREEIKKCEISICQACEAENLLITYRDNPPLCDAAAKGDKKRAEQLLKNGANPTHACRDAKSLNYQKTPLMIAATAGNTEIMVELRACQQVQDTINQANELKKTALHYAIEHHHPGAVSLLLELGADPYPKDLAPENTPLMASAEQGDLETIRLLLEDKRIQSDKQAKNLFLKKLIELGRIEIAKSVIEPADPEFFQNLLHFAVESKSLPLTKFVSENKATIISEKLLLRTVELDQADILKLWLPGFTKEHLDSLLHIAIQTGKMYAADALSHAGADIHLVNNNGDTYIHLAVNAKKLNSTEWLLKKGVDPNLTNKQGKTPLKLAIETADWEQKSLLLAYGADPNPLDSFKTSLMSAIDCNNTKAVGFLLDAKRTQDTTLATLNHQDKENNTALHYAVRKGDLEVVHLLLEKGADPNISNGKGETPLTLAAFKIDKKTGAQLTALLLESKIALDQKNKNAALLLATEKGNTEVIQQLLNVAAKPNPRILEIGQEKKDQVFVKSIFTAAVECGEYDMMWQAQNILAENKERKESKKEDAVKSISTEEKINAAKRLAAHIKKKLDRIILENTGFWNRLSTWLFSRSQLLSPMELARCKKVSGLLKNLDLAKLNWFYRDKQHPLVAQELSLLKQYCDYSGITDLTPRKVGDNLQLSDKKKTLFIDYKGADLFNKINECDIEGIESLLKDGADPNLIINDNTPLMKSVCLSPFDGIRKKFISSVLLESKNIQINKQNRYGKSALVSAVLEGGKYKIGSIKRLLNAGADINLPNKQGLTPLHHAVLEKWLGVSDLTTLLLENGADPRAKNQQGRTPLNLIRERIGDSIVERRQQDKAVSIIKSYITNPSLCRAAAQNNAEKAAQLIRNNANPNAKNEDGQTALDIARERKYYNVAKAIFEVAVENGKWELAYQACDVVIENKKGFPVDNLFSHYQQADKIIMAKRFVGQIKQELGQLIEANKRSSFWSFLSRTPSLSPSEWIECETLIDLLSDLETLDFTNLPNTNGQHPFVAKKLLALKKYCEYAGLNTASLKAMHTPRPNMEKAEFFIETKHPHVVHEDPVPISVKDEEGSIIIDTKHTIKTASPSEAEPKKEKEVEKPAPNSLFFEAQQKERKLAEAAAQVQHSTESSPASESEYVRQFTDPNFPPCIYG